MYRQPAGGLSVVLPPPAGRPPSAPAGPFNLQRASNICSEAYYPFSSCALESAGKLNCSNAEGALQTLASDVRRPPMSVNDQSSSSAGQLAWDILFALTDHEFPSPEGALPSRSTSLAAHGTSQVQPGQGSGAGTVAAGALQPAMSSSGALGSHLSCPPELFVTTDLSGSDNAVGRITFSPTSASDMDRRAISVPVFRKFPAGVLASGPGRPAAHVCATPQAASLATATSAVTTGRARVGGLTSKRSHAVSMNIVLGVDGSAVHHVNAGRLVVSTNESSPEHFKRPSGTASARKSPSSFRGAGQPKRRCIADGCNADISQLKEYYRRRKLCEECINSREIQYGGCSMRFCQQCSKLHSVGEFDGPKRSCRKRLEKHRLAVSKRGSMQSASTSASPDSTSSKLYNRERRRQSGL